MPELHLCKLAAMHARKNSHRASMMQIASSRSVISAMRLLVASQFNASQSEIKRIASSSQRLSSWSRHGLTAVQVETVMRMALAHGLTLLGNRDDLPSRINSRVVSDRGSNVRRMKEISPSENWPWTSHYAASYQLNIKRDPVQAYRVQYLAQAQFHCRATVMKIGIL